MVDDDKAFADKIREGSKVDSPTDTAKPTVMDKPKKVKSKKAKATAPTKVIARKPVDAVAARTAHGKKLSDAKIAATKK